jgi:hypothetical protein
LTVTGATGAFANSNLTFTGGVLSVGAPTVGAAANSVNVQGGYYVNGVAFTSGSTIAGSTTAGNLLTATGTSGGLYGNSNVTFTGGTFSVTGNAVVSTTLRWGAYCNALTQTGNAFARLFGNYIGTPPYPNDFFITNNMLTPTITDTGITATSNDAVSVSGTAAIRLGTVQTGGTYGAITLYTGLQTAALVPSLVVSNTYAAIGTSTMPAFSGLNVNGGLSLSNGYRPLYASVTGTSLTSGTSPTIVATSYGTHYNILNSAFSAITLPTSSATTDLNAYWVFRNNTGAYLSITVTYTGTGGGGTGILTIPPANSTTIMFVAGTTTSGIGAYAFF